MTRTPEQGHTKRCLAETVQAAVGWLCSDPETTDVEFRVAMQDNYALAIADEWLRERDAMCICPPLEQPAGFSEFSSRTDG